jgi:DNA-binding NarL/FixJ family response regulator
MRTNASRPTGESTPVRVIVVDDHPAVRQGLSLLLEPEGITVCAEAGGRAEALARVEEFRPDLAVVDLSLGEEDGMGLVADLHERGMPALVYSMHEDGMHVESAIAAGALGYVTKREIHRVLVNAIREVAAGRRFISPRAALALADRVADARTDNACDELSNQEREVYSLLGEGAGTTEIAAAMNISTRTVESYYARILVKLELEGMRDLRRHAINHLRNHTS